MHNCYVNNYLKHKDKLSKKILINNKDTLNSDIKSPRGIPVEYYELRVF